MKKWKHVVCSLLGGAVFLTIGSCVALADGLPEGVVVVDDTGVHIQSDGEYLVDARDILPGDQFSRQITIENTTKVPILLSFAVKEPHQVAGPIHFDESLDMRLSLDNVPFFVGNAGGVGDLPGGEYLKAWQSAVEAKKPLLLYNYMNYDTESKLTTGDGVTVVEERSTDTASTREAAKDSKDTADNSFAELLKSDNSLLDVEQVLTLASGNDVPFNLQERPITLAIIEPGEKASFDASFVMDETLTNDAYTEKSITENKWVFSAKQVPVTEKETGKKPATKVPQFGDMGGSTAWFIIIGALVVLIGVTYVVKKQHEKDGEGSHE